MRRFLTRIAVLVACGAILGGGLGLAIATVAPRATPSGDAPRAVDQPRHSPSTHHTAGTPGNDSPALDHHAKPGAETRNTPSPASTTIPITSTRAYDPFGDGYEHDEWIPRATDGNTATAWETEHYSSADLGGLKGGVGLLVDLGKPHAVQEVQLRLRSGGATLELRAGGAPGSLLDGPAVRTVRDAGATPTLRSHAKARYWVVWFTHLPSQGGHYRGGVAEIRFLG